MSFHPISFNDACISPDSNKPIFSDTNKFYIYGVIARLAILAAAKELYNLIEDPDEKTNLIEQNLPIEKELEAILEAIAEEIQKSPIPIPLGTMIETPRAALIAGELAQHVDFISFGTNDLTQMTFGFM